MKQLAQFLAETRPSTQQLKPTPDATPTERELARVDTSQKRAIGRLAKQKGVTSRDIERQLRTSDTEVDPETAATPRKAAEFQYAATKTGRGKSDELKADIQAKRRDIKAKTGKKLGDIQVDDEGEQEIIKGKTDDMLAGMSQRQRMRLGARAVGARGGLTGDETQNVAFNRAVLRGAGADVGEPVQQRTGAKRGKGPEETTIARMPGQRHLFQGQLKREPTPTDIPSPEDLGSNEYTDEDSGYKYFHNGSKWLPDMSEDDALTLASTIRDRSVDPQLTKDEKGDTLSRVSMVTRGVGDQPLKNMPSVEELKGISEPMIKQAAKAGEISKADEKTAFALLDAFKEGEEDPVKAQELAFIKSVGQVGDKHPAIKEFLLAVGMNPQDWYKAGAMAGSREEAGYGGDLGKRGEKYRVPGSPEGVYNLAKMAKENKNLYDLAKINRGNEVIRTYLQQDGTNAYAQWEGQRSIGEMNLEHILDLAGGGWDHPSNWVWASAELNNMKSSTGGFGRSETYLDDIKSTPAVGRGFSGIVRQMARAEAEKEPGRGVGKRTTENIERITKEIQDAVPEMSMTKAEYEELTPNQQRDARIRAQKAGLSREDAESLLPMTVVTRPGARENPEAYEKERLDTETWNQETTTAFRDIAKAQGLSRLDQAEATREGQAAVQKIRALRSGAQQDDNDDLE